MNDPLAVEQTLPVIPPPLHLLPLELRAPFELLRFLPRLLRAGNLPPGDGHPVIVIPGFGFGDGATAPLRRALTLLGYPAHGWGQGRNLGMRPPLKAALAQYLHDVVAASGSPASLVGWSLGGVFARELARHHPQAVRRVVTLGSPINGNPAANSLAPLLRLARGAPDKNLARDVAGFLRRRIAPPVPCVAVYSRSDGIVAWQCCLELPSPLTENVEVRGSHCGLIANPQVLRALALRLPIA